MAVENKIVVNFVTNLKSFGQQVQNFSKKFQELTDKFYKAKKSIKDTGDEAQKSGKKAEKGSKGFSKFVRSLGRIAYYRAIRKTISELAQAFKEGVQNAYAYSSAMGGLDSTNLKGNLDSIATSVLYLKNALGAALTPVIQTLTPILVSLADKLAGVANSISMVFGALTGNSTYTFAKKFGTVWNDTLSDATSKAQELKRSLLGFDEINRLDAPDTSSSSSSSSTTDASEYFDEGVVTDKAKKIAETLKKVVLPVVLAIGTAFASWQISSGLTSALSSITGSSSAIEGISSKITKVLASITLITTGIALIVAGVYDVINTGGSLSSWLAIISGIALVVAGIAIAFGGIPALITGITLVVGALALFIATHWEEIKAKALEVFETIKTKVSEIWLQILQIPIIGKIAHLVQTIIEAAIKIVTKVIEVGAKIREIFLALFVALGKAIYTYVISPIMEKLSAFVSWVKSNIITPIINFFKPIATTVANFIGGTIKGVVNGIFSLIEKTINGFIKLLNSAIKVINTIPGVSITKVSELSLPRLASGGFVSQGQLFVANEAGAEMVGSMDGHTAVANNQQIVEGIKQGVLEAMLMSSNNQNITLNVDGKQLFDIMVDRNNSQVRTSGKSPLLV